MTGNRIAEGHHRRPAARDRVGDTYAVRSRNVANFQLHGANFTPMCDNLCRQHIVEVIPMAYFLAKTDPDTYSLDDVLAAEIIAHWGKIRPMELEVRYVTTSDGVRIAYAIAGSGPPMVTFSDPIASHVQLGWSHPVLGRFFQEMARRNTVLFFDFRGCGLSDRLPAHTVSLDDAVRDAEAVVQRVGWREFAMNAGGGGSPAAIAFAARHPEQVSRLALADGFARANDMLSQPQVQALVAAAKLDWILATEAIGTAAFGVGREESSGYGAYIRSCIDPEYLQNTDVLADR